MRGCFHSSRIVIFSNPLPPSPLSSVAGKLSGSPFKTPPRSTSPRFVTPPASALTAIPPRLKACIDGIAGADDARAHLPPGQRPRLLHLMDREGDIHEALEILADSRDGAIIRRAMNRSMEGPPG